jgi:hypothetical protein
LKQDPRTLATKSRTRTALTWRTERVAAFLTGYFGGSTGGLERILWLLALFPRLATAAIEFLLIGFPSENPMWTTYLAAGVGPLMYLQLDNRHGVKYFKRLAKLIVLKLFPGYLLCKALGANRTLDWTRDVDTKGVVGDDWEHSRRETLDDMT